MWNISFTTEIILMSKSQRFHLNLKGLHILCVTAFRLNTTAEVLTCKTTLLCTIILILL